MAGKRMRVSATAKGKEPAIPTAAIAYHEMLREALLLQPESSERPLKRPRTGRRRSPVERPKILPATVKSDDEDDVEFEDVLDDDHDGKHDTPQKRQQTTYKDSEDESDGSDYQADPYDFDMQEDDEEPSGDLELTLVKRPEAAPQRRAVVRRKAVTKADRVARLEIHKLHILCLLSFLDRRNNWCSDEEVLRSLKPLIDKKTLKFLRPPSSLSQFGRTESLKRGLGEVSQMWKARFDITARGMRRALWADDESQIQDFKVPEKADLAFEKPDFIKAAQKLSGSRDVGAQLYCALLRSVGLETRLVCSLQPLSFIGGGPSLPKTRDYFQKQSTPVNNDEDDEELNINASHSSFVFANPGERATGTPFTARGRLGHPSAADYNIPEMSRLSRPAPKPRPKKIEESPFPIFWVEVFDEAHQKWFPVDPLITDSIAKPRAFEPPSSDRENAMSYVIAFDDEGFGRDVTRRYAKAYNAKTRRNRVESTHGGEKWMKRVMRTYARRRWQTDADTLEESELTMLEAREPMPKNIQDFKDHPVYALERHLKRNEILTSTKSIGRVAAGKDPSVPGGKKMENIYRRNDVKVARSADAWYRLGRDIKMGVQPVKTVETKRPKNEDDMDVEDDRPGTNLYTEHQTELYEAPPVVDGRVPKNSYGNLDLFVPSMVPRGGIHLPYVEANRAARILGIDYADALTGFEFRGRHGTAVLKGIVVAIEYQEAVEAVIKGFRDELLEAEEQRRSERALHMWEQFLLKLRIKQRIDSYADPDEEVEVEGSAPGSEAEVEEESDVTEEYEYDEDEGGGFLPE